MSSLHHTKFICDVIVSSPHFDGNDLSIYFRDDSISQDLRMDIVHAADTAQNATPQLKALYKSAALKLETMLDSVLRANSSYTVTLRHLEHTVFAIVEKLLGNSSDDWDAIALNLTGWVLAQAQLPPVGMASGSPTPARAPIGEHHAILQEVKALAVEAENKEACEFYQTISHRNIQAIARLLAGL